MLHLKRREIADHPSLWEEKGFALYHFDDRSITEETGKAPQWLHIGGGNLFRAYIAVLQQRLLDQGLVHTGLIAATTHNAAVVDDVFRPHDNLHVHVTMTTDGQFGKEVIGSVCETVAIKRDRSDDWQRLLQIFTAPSMQLVSFTITEKGYNLKDYDGNYYADVASDLEKGPEQTVSSMGSLAALTYVRYQAGVSPIAFVSMDNCSHNGDRLRLAFLTFAEAWQEKGYTDAGFTAYIAEKTAFPYSMIDKIVPGPSPNVQTYLKDCGFADTDYIKAGNSSYALFVNSEAKEYLVIEDDFPNGRPPLEKAGVIFTDRETVNQCERMKVGTCLNPLHTTLAVYGCLLGYVKIADEIGDPQLRGLAEKIGYDEGLPVAVNPGVLNPKAFIDELLQERLPNPNVPDTPQRIASDTSQKVGVRYGNTIKAYGEKAKNLKYIPLAIAGWCRYLLAVDDTGKDFEPSPDPLLKELQQTLSSVRFGQPETAEGSLHEILSNRDIFGGADLCKAGLESVIEGYFKELIAGPGAVRAVLKKYVG
ncbi:mannitol dehydrogenase family protein [Selenomonas sp. TAMA-11512]|uniref:mannitol dehydrogenase family protein n=1 Tax=Selenomonas sp. TAMA-11512 TaxID=3095337 RepID=UPI0030893A8B|nr:mannitol dehydrogenase family protein [Selenomonas sp. TAMA-11512]